MEKPTYQEILNELVTLKIEGPTNITQGICYHCDKFSEWMDFYCEGVTVFYSKWGHFSDNPVYPVPSTFEDLTEEDAYYKTHNLWVNEYGKLRLSLLDYLIHKFQTLASEEGKTDEILSSER